MIAYINRATAIGFFLGIVTLLHGQTTNPERINALKGIERWQALEAYLIARKKFSAPPSTSYEFLPSNLYCDFSSRPFSKVAPCPFGLAGSWTIDPKIGSLTMTLPQPGSKQPYYVREFRSFVVENDVPAGAKPA